MASYGGKTRTKKIAREQQERGRGRMPKRPRGSHLTLVIEPAIGPVPRYTMPTLLDPRTISTSISSTPTDLSAMSRPGVSMPVESSQYQSSHADEVTEQSSDEGSSSGEDVDATASDIVLEESGRVRGSDRPRLSRRVGERNAIATIKLIGHGVPRFFRGEIKKRVEDLWSYYSNVDQVVKDSIWEAFLDRYEIQGGSIPYARQIWEFENQKKWRDLLTKGKASAMQDHGVDDVALLLGMSCPDGIHDLAMWEKYVTYWCQDEERAIATQARQNPMTPVGGPDGKPAVYSLGSKSLHERVRDGVRCRGLGSVLRR
ncbi:hypothetical protein LIER_39999 [Lithospermum erythrorhizon]|uniref:Uncharacterized protein n=1 Tax=Lithospermum erythrorhizon TaxID=34254 RepID=A0AAV3QNA7_LITER